MGSKYSIRRMTATGLKADVPAISKRECFCADAADLPVSHQVVGGQFPKTHLFECPLFGEVREPVSPTPRQTLYEQSSLTGVERIWGQTSRPTFAHSHGSSEHSPPR